MVDWSQCSDVETVSGRMGGKPVIKGTRVEPDAIIANLEGGSSVEEVHENYPHVPEATIRRIIAYHRACTHQLTH